MTHDLKIKYEFAQLHFQGKKDWELRLNDRDFKTGDLIRFTVLEIGFVYTRTIEAIFNDFGLQENYVILSLKKH
jgi:ASC-1-like (ASCH) protein